MNRRIAFCSPNLNKYSETFIHRQMEGLKGQMRILHGGYMPDQVTENQQNPPLNLMEGWKPGFISKLFEADEATLRKQALTDRLHSYLETEKIEVVLAQYGPTGVEMSEICVQTGIPLVVHFHGFDAYRNDTLGSYGLRYPELFDRAAALVVVSEDMQQQLIQLGAPPEKIKLIHYGIDTDFFSPGPSLTGPPRFIAVGRFVSKKGPLQTIQAFAQVLKTLPEAQLVMVGEGELKSAAEQLVTELGIQERIEFPGVLGIEEVRNRLQNSHAFVQHSLLTSEHDSEGLPLSILEASATRLPIIATQHAGIPESVEHGTTGWLVEPGEVDEMANFMIQVGQDLSVSAQMGMAGRKKMVEQFTLSRYLQELQHLIDSV